MSSINNPDNITPIGPDGEPIEPGDLDARYVKKTGDKVTGELEVEGRLPYPRRPWRT